MSDSAAAAPRLPLIGITMGDPLGIGPEVIVKALADSELRQQARFVIFGFHDTLEIAADAENPHNNERPCRETKLGQEPLVITQACYLVQRGL